MLNVKSLIVLLILAVASMYFAITNWKSADDTSVSNQLLFPQLTSKANDIDVIEVQRGDTELTLNRTADTSDWTLANRDNYPASAAVVARFIRGMSELRKLEQKTSDPDRYEQLSLGDPKVEDSGATLYRLKAGESDVVEMIVGKTRSAASNADQQELYVRMPDAPESWLAQGEFVDANTTVAWLNQTIVEVATDAINVIQVDHPGEESVIIQAKNDAPGQFELAEIPEGYKVKLEFAINDLASAFSNLDLVDVFAENDTDYTGGITVTVDTVDGLRVRVQTGTVNGEPVARFAAMEGPLPESSSATSETDKETKSNEDMATVIANLNERWSGWVYKVRDFKLQNITRKKSDFIELDTPAETSESGEPTATDSQ